jgi:hypothetical protein
MDILKEVVQRARASREHSQQILHDMCIHIDKLQQQVLDQQRQLNTYRTYLLSLEKMLPSIDNLFTQLTEQQQYELWKSIRKLGRDR